jgi:hypothetical protein
MYRIRRMEMACMNNIWRSNKKRHKSKGIEKIGFFLLLPTETINRIGTNNYIYKQYFNFENSSFSYRLSTLVHRVMAVEEQNLE